jgi:mannosyltransferase
MHGPVSGSGKRRAEARRQSGSSAPQGGEPKVRFGGELLDFGLILLFVLFVARVWIMAMPSSLWVDELVTVFVVRHPGDASFAVAPQVPASLYYWLPRLSMALFGSSEIAIRMPSVAAAFVALFFIGRLAARLIHPDAAWLAVFACLAFHSFDYFSIDARPYGLGIAVASASLLFLVRWLDGGDWRDAAVFVALASTLWYIHLFYWPFYLIYALYAGFRLFRRDTPVRPAALAVAAAIVAAALSPVALTALRIAREAQAHAFNPLPTLRNLFYLLHAQVILLCAAAAWAVRRLVRGPKVSPGAAVLILSWWLACPVALFAYSRLTGNGVLITRYVSPMLPGMALAVTFAAAFCLRNSWWRPAAFATGAVALAFLGQWHSLLPSHEGDNWRDAAAMVRRSADAGTAVLCPSPFIEAQWPVWTPDYKLPGFLYSHLNYYALAGRVRLLPFQPSPESERYTEGLLGSELAPSGKFILYGSTWAVRKVDRWLSGRPDLVRWRKEWRNFDTLSVVVYRSPEQAIAFDKQAARDIR